MSAPYQQKSNNTANASLTTNTSEDGQNTPAKDTIALSPFDFCEETRLYRRIDEQMIAIDPERALKNAVHGGMSGIGLVERYEVYEKEGTQDIAVVVRVGGRLCGPPGHVHGGIIATLFDNSFGWLFINAKLKGAFTANLNINYRKPIEVGTTGVIKAKITEMQGRKLFMSATWELDGVVHAESTTLFVIPKGASPFDDSTTAATTGST